MKGIKITENDKCVNCFLSHHWFVKTVDGYYRCPECKTLWNKLQDGTYKLVEGK